MPKKKPIWEPFQKGYLPILEGQKLQDMVEVISQELGINEEEALKRIEETMKEDEVWVNHIYQVNIRKEFVPALDTSIVHLSIKRKDKAPIRDWRHFQRIKNELVGEECEGVEIFPAESRLVDGANQYHIWVIKDPKFRFPFGFSERVVTSKKDAAKMGATQRDFD